MAGYLNCQTRFQFHQTKRVEPWNEVARPVTSDQMHMMEKPCVRRIDRRVRVPVKVLKVLVQES